MVRTRTQNRALVNQYIRNLEARGVRVQTVVLSGSYARNNAHAGSDIDLAVIAPQFARLNIRERYETLGMANLELRAPIQAIGYAPRQWRYPEQGSFIILGGGSHPLERVEEAASCSFRIFVIC